MTRLQRMFIDLSQYKTVEELEKATSDSFVDDLFLHLAFDKNGKVHTCGYFTNCNDCAIGCGKSEESPTILTINYLNEEIDGSRPLKNSIAIMRTKALDALIDVFNSARTEYLNPLNTALYLDSACSLLEYIGLFEADECHNSLIKTINKRNKK